APGCAATVGPHLAWCGAAASAGLGPLLERLVERLEGGLSAGEGLAREGHEQAAEALALDQPGATVHRAELETVLAADDARQAGDPPQLDAGLGDDDLGLDGHGAAGGRLLAGQPDSLPGDDVPGRLQEERVPFRVAAQIGEDGPHRHRRGADLDRRRYRPHPPRILRTTHAEIWGPGSVRKVRAPA